MMLLSLYRNREKDLGSQNGFIEKKSTKVGFFSFLLNKKHRKKYGAIYGVKYSTLWTVLMYQNANYRYTPTHL